MLAIERTFKIILISLTLISTNSFSQDFCDQKLSEAVDKFELGRFYEIPDILSLCLSSGFSREEKIRAYRLLTLSYLYLDYQTSADEAYLELLKLSPEYQLDEEIEPNELINHHKKFTTRPQVYLSASAGFNFTFYDQISDVSMNNSDDGSQSERSLVGYRVGLGGEFTILGNLHLGVEGNIVKKNFEFTESQFQLDSLSVNQITSHRQSYTEFEVPVYLKYTFFKPKFSPYVTVGVAPTFLLLAGISDYQTGVQNILENENIAISPQPDVDIYDLRRKFNYSVMAGVGLKYKFGINYLTFEARYQKSMYNYSLPEKIWDSSSIVGKGLKYPSAYVDDFFKLDELSFTVGFIYPLYKPRKIVD